MLVTTCSHCKARFRVTPEQLNLRQGQVRCGQCHQAFNGFESLERFPGDDTGARLLARRAGQGSPSGASDSSDEFGEDVLVPTVAPDSSGSAIDAPDFGSLPEVPDLLLESEVHGEQTVASSLEEPAATPVAVAVNTPVEAPVERPPRAAHAKASLPSYPDAEPPAAEPPARPSRAWTFGVVLLALLLALQLTYAFRARIAQQYPVLRPLLDSVCAAAGCAVPWMNDEAALKLEDSELLEVPGKPGQIALQARIRNLSPTAQEYPHLELTLTDTTGQTAVRRVLRPADYLGHTPVVGEVMAAGSEALLSVRLETGSIRPTGYELLLFYP